MKRFLLTVIIVMSCLTASMKAQPASRPTSPKIGLALGGGGAKGAATVGVLKELEQAGIEYDYIAGTSIGAIIGALYSCGYRSGDLDQLFTNQNWIDIFTGSLQGPAISVLLDSLLTNAPVKVEKGWMLTSGNKSKSEQRQGMIPFRCVAANIRTNQPVILKDGDIVKSLRASMAIPGIFKPIKIGKDRLIDGGTQNNLPVDVVRAMGADVVIAIDLTQNKHPDYEGLGLSTGIPLIDWLANRPDIKLYNKNREDADIYINPDLHEFGVASFRPNDIITMMRRGTEEAQKLSPAIEELRKKKQKRR